MKKISLLLLHCCIVVLLIVSLIITKSVIGADSVATPSPTLVSTPSGSLQIDKQIQNLKDKIANKVEELRKKDQKALAGIITTIGKDNTIKITTNDDREMQIKYDSTLTKIYIVTGSSKKEMRFSDLGKGDYIIVTGPIMDTTVTANVIYKDDQYLVKVGKVTEVNKTDYYLKVLSTEKDTYTLDIETYTKLMLMDIKTLTASKSGISKVKEGDTVHFAVKKPGNEKEVNRYSAEKILVIPQEYFSK